MSFTIATWNINSARLRVGLAARYLEAAGPDVLCLQEIKCRTEEFPYKAFAAAGYPHAHAVGQKGMHGVAIVSRLPLEPIETDGVCPKAEARHQRVRIDGVEIENFYIPAGGDVPDRAENPRFAHKLDFLDALEGHFAERARAGGDQIVVGDLNIAPYEHDVWSHKQLLTVVSHTPVETEGLERVRAAGDYIDVARALIPEPEKLYTWWSYRARDWHASNRGRRLDHIWVSPSLREAALSKGRAAFRIWHDVRGWEKPSDHAPVTLRLNG